MANVAEGQREFSLRFSLSFPLDHTNLCARSVAAVAAAVPCRAVDVWPRPVANPAKAAIENCWPCWNWPRRRLHPLPAADALLGAATVAAVGVAAVAVAVGSTEGIHAAAAAVAVARMR